VKRILFLTQGDLETPSSRHRVYQYLPALEKAGYEAVVHPAVRSEEHYEAFIARTWPGLMQRLFSTFTRRVRDLHQLRDFDYIYVQKPILPAPLFNIELRIAREAKMIFDFDDAIYFKKPGGNMVAQLWPQAQRISQICKRAHRVVVGNKHLGDFVQKLKVDPIILPTGIDTDIYEEQSRYNKRDHKISVLGWVGSPATSTELNLIVPSLIDLHSKAPFVCRVIGGAPATIPVRFPIEWRDWSLEKAISDVAHLDIGLAPMRDTPWNRGKCGLKVLQYWGAGVPVVASPVGVYKQMIRDGENGMLASNREEWTEKILALLKNADLRRKVVEGGRQTVREHYSLKALAPQFISIFEEAEEAKIREQPIS